MFKENEVKERKVMEGVKMENKNNIQKRLLEFLRFPGILVIGIFLFFYSVLRFNHWALIDIMFLAGIGLVLILLGITSHFKSESTMTMIGSVLSGIAMIDFYWYSRRIEDSVAIFYSLGIIVLLFNIIINYNKQSPGFNKITPPSEPYEDVFDKEFVNKLKEFQEMHNSYLSFKKDDRDKLIALNQSRKTALEKVLKTCESLTVFLEKNKDKEGEGIDSIRIRRDELRDELRDKGIMPMLTNKGETIFPDDEVKKYEVINKEERPRDFKGYPKIKEIIKPGYLVGSEVLRKARIEADWSSSDDNGKR